MNPQVWKLPAGIPLNPGGKNIYTMQSPTEVNKNNEESVTRQI